MLIRATVNGERVVLDVEPRRRLVDVVREDLGLVGTNVGCGHGVCGACTVLLDGVTVKSCLLFAVQVDGHEITTIEGVSPAEGLNPVQAAFKRNFSIQCG
jgi:aerobic-type carbon monoxide dehydrogenase small subunit (CoxS/CutS family)